MSVTVSLLLRVKVELSGLDSNELVESIRKGADVAVTLRPRVS